MGDTLEQETRRLSQSEQGTDIPKDTAMGVLAMERRGLKRFWDRVNGKGRRHIGILESLKNFACSSWLNILLVFVPAAWGFHFSQINQNPENVSMTHHITTWSLCFHALIPLEHLLDWGGEQMCHYLGRELGDLLLISLNNAVEATLAIILLTRCELKLLQSTIVGVVLLHLLLVPGCSFLVHGARIWSQDLHPHNTELNQSLLVMGSLTLLVPAAYFAALDRGIGAGIGTAESIVDDTTRGHFLRISRGIAFILLVVYICSRIFLHDPPGDDNAFQVHPDAPEELKREELEFATLDPETSLWVCIAVLVVAVGVMAYTAEILVENVEFVRQEGNIQEEWFGLFLLPIVSFAADGAIAVGYFVRLVLKLVLGTPVPPSSLAKARSIDLAIQFILFWMPFIVLLGWWTGKPMSLLFDLFDVSVLLGACFLVNYVTADKKTNWIEGLIMISFYTMIVLTAWYYPGQAEVDDMNACLESVVQFISEGGTSAPGKSGE